MAIIWLDSAATGLNDGTSYTDAYTAVASTTSAAAGDIIYVVSTHSQDFTVATTIDYSNSTFSNPIKMISVNSSGVYTKSTINNFTLSNTSADFKLEGFVHTFGVNFLAQNDLYIPNEGWGFNNCKLTCGTASVAGHLKLNGWTSTNDSPVTFDGVELNFLNSASRAEQPSFYNKFIFRNVFKTSSTLYFFRMNADSRGGYIIIEDSDLTNASSNIILGDIAHNLLVSINRCKIASGAALTSGTITNPASSLLAHSVDIGDGYHYFEEQYYSGTITEDTATYRTAGATYDGTNEFSAEMVGNANTSYYAPLKFELANFFLVPNTATSVDFGGTTYSTNITFKVHFVLDDGTTLPTALKDSEFWIEVEHADGLDNAKGVLVSTRAAPLAAGATHTTESSLWTGVTASKNVQMSDSIQVTIGASAGNLAAGAVRVNCYLARDLASTNQLFVCPLVDLS